MNTSSHNSNSKLTIAESYYRKMLEKNFDAMASFLHPNVLFISPLAELTGKNAVIDAAINLSNLLDNIEIRAKFHTGNQIMLAYDFMFTKPLGKLRAAVLMEFQDLLISKIELFYDGRPFEHKKDTIFSQNNVS